MPEARSNAESLVFRAISAERAPSRADRQELPSLDLVGAAIAHAARLAAAEDRARHAYAILQRSQTAELLRAAREAAHATRNPAQRPHDPLFADLAAATASDEGCVIPATARAGRFVWRFHPAPADAGAPIASSGDGALA
jgi:hypothetical protein